MLSGTVAITVTQAGTVAWVNLYVDGSYLTTTPPLSFDWDSTKISNGSHQISATAYAANSAIVGTASISVTVQNGATPTATVSLTPTATPTPGGLFFTGGVSVDGMAVASAAVTFYAAGNSGYGSMATSLGTATTDINGNYTISYACPMPNPALETYVIARGGDAGHGPNSAIGLMAPIGPCSSIDASTIVILNEFTTAAAEVALAQFVDWTGQMLGTSSTNGVGLGLGYINYYNLAEVDSAGDYSVSGSASTFMPTEEACGADSPPTNCDALKRLNTLSNLIAACASGSGPNSSPCSAMFTNTSTSAANTTLAAIHAIARNPAAGVDALFAIQSMISTPPYQPFLATPPDGYEIGLALTPANTDVGVNTNLAIDALGNLFTVSFNGSNGFLNEISASTGYTNGATFAQGPSSNQHGALAIDSTNNLFFASPDFDAVEELTAISAYTSGTFFIPGGGGAFDHPQSIALDGDGNVFVVNRPASGGSISELIALGNYSTAFGYRPNDANLTCPAALAIDSSANIFVTNCDNTVSELTVASSYASGLSFEVTADETEAVSFPESFIGLDTGFNLFVMVNGSAGGGAAELGLPNYSLDQFFFPITAAVAAPSAMVLDSAGDVFAATSTSGGWSVSELTFASDYGSEINYSPTGASFCDSGALAIDAAGNIFAANKCAGTASTPVVSELLGLAVPVLTPPQACLQRGGNICLP